jgi:sodium/proline symporter
VLLGIGFWARRRAQSASGFFIGDRTLGPWIAALSYAAGSSSAWSILGVSGIAFSQGLSAVWIIPGTLTGHLVVWFWIAPKLHALSHQQGWITLTDLLAYGAQPSIARWIYRLSAVVILLCFTFYVAAQFQGAANTFTSTFAFDFTTALFVGVGVVLIYTLWGGFWAVSLTDALQAMLMLAAALILPVTALIAVGGFAGLMEQQSASVYWQWDGGHSGWFGLGFFLGMLSIGFGPLGQPHLLNRIMALKSARSINIARTIAVTWFVIVLSGMFLLGVCAQVLLGSVGDSEQVFFVLAQTLLPSVVTGIMIAAVLSAIMSTADSQLLVAGSAIQHDLLRNQSRWSATTNSRVAVLLVAFAATLLALYLPESIFSRVLFAWNALGAAFGPIVIARLLAWRLSGWSVLLALTLGFGLTVALYLRPDGPGDIWERAIPFIAAFVTLLAGRTSSRYMDVKIREIS